MSLTKEQKLNRAFLIVETKVQQIEQKLLNEHKFNVSQRELIYLVFIKDNYGKRMQKIGELMGLSKGAFSNTVKTLVDKKLVKKTKSKKDNRIITLSLDTNGENVYKLHKEARKQVNKRMMKFLSTKECEIIFELGNKISKEFGQ